MDLQDHRKNAVAKHAMATLRWRPRWHQNLTRTTAWFREAICTCSRKFSIKVRT